MADDGDEHDVGVLGIDRDAADVVRVLEADVRPRPPAVDRPVHAIAVADRIAQRRFAAPDVDDVGVRRRDRERADRRDRLRVEHRRPRAARVHRFPDAAVDRAEVELVRPARDAAHRIDASAAERTEHPPTQTRIETRVVWLLSGHQSQNRRTHADRTDRTHDRWSKIRHEDAPAGILR